ncbi:site-specific DNA-methyltransferase [Rhodoblastus acidophilus]|uniref:site-specific DNA-methyltransferase (adenine-specific) n=1 Tax=Candidatus Rhodoblastus alkanivorans TaxID=2954117 RepID=A0ABS9Z0P6_9HYPH|nr:site-specific DNA-methyltransferase [Candidatus Rhodoblastus alkanivorans]MCI4678174.1 site-specific DNA-methyltransferase [Candidatus Rhodoblastus alkanivorans]MCI4681224.1 site-specific DNA-methyltransferase [Candidatus Rhodoblastus alkanivorans]MDI4642268.1 site-specific DNA-methyltransferase [Rhodoblastus acidophilus]
MEKLKMHSPDLTQENIAQIRALFPGCVTEAMDENGKVRLAIDFDQLRQELSDHIVEGAQERYRLDWPGKREALINANAPIAKTLRPADQESVGFSTTKNLFVEGDNLEALKLLQDIYIGSVRMIYIDPPYNTGNDFVYRDRFAQGSEEYLRISNQKDEEGNRLIANLTANGRFHSEWLSMMYPRLKVAKNLLSDDGALFVSIDDTEVAGLRHMLDEIFGAENFITEIVWEGANKNDARQIGVSHEYVLCYVKDKSATKTSWTMTKEGVDPVLREVDRLKGVHGKDFETASEELAGWFRAMKATPSFGLRRFRYIDERGAYKEDDPTAPGGRKFELKNPKTGEVIPLRPNRGWAFDQETFNRMVEEGRISFISPTSVMVRRYLHETDAQTPQSVFYQPARSASERLSKLLGGGYFDFPKDETIIQKFVDMAVSEDSGGPIVMDFFAGSSTTAHSVFLQNALDGKNRRFIMVQIPEPTNENSVARKAGWKNIAEISKERIRRAGKQILEGDCHGGWSRDVGFRVLKVDTSNMQDVYYRPDQVDQKDLLHAVDNIKPDRTAEDLLFQVLVDWGVDLTLPIRRETMQGKTVFFVDDNALVACFDTGVTEELVKELAGREPLRVVFRDNGFVSDAVKINVEQVFRQVSPSTDVKSI